MKKEIQEFWSLIEKSEKILLINHIRMDGDAWGSLGGLMIVLKNMWKVVRAINDDNVPNIISFLGNTDFIEPDLDVKNYDPDIIISLDASDTGRLWKSYETWKNTFDEKIFIVIDHHISNPWFGNINIIDAEASSVCEMMADIIQELKLDTYMTPEAATFLYMWLQTDSNMYFNTNTRPGTLRAWAYLMEQWADFRLPISELYKKRTKSMIQVWQHAFQYLTYHYDDTVCWCVLSRAGLESLWLKESQISECFKGLISEILINIDGINIAYLLYPLDDGENKISMRSKAWYNVAEICETFHWGGHKQAAGFQSTNTVEEIEIDLLKKIKTSIEAK